MSPAGMSRRVRKVRGMNCAARMADVSSARASPSSRYWININPETIRRIPVIAPAIAESMLPAFTYPMIPPAIVRTPKTKKYIFAGSSISLRFVLHASVTVQLCTAETKRLRSLPERQKLARR